MARGKGQAASDAIISQEIARTVGLGRPAEGPIPIESILSRGRRFQNISGGPATADGLPAVLPGFPVSRAAMVFNRQAIRSGAGRGQDSGSPSGVGGGTIAGPRATLGLSSADKAVALAIPGIPGMLAGGVALANRLFGPIRGVIGGSVAPRPGTQGFRDVVGASRAPLGVRSGFGGPKPGGLF